VPPKLLPIPPQPQPQSGQPTLFASSPSIPPAYVDVFLTAGYTQSVGGGKLHLDTFNGVVRPTLFDLTNFWFNCPRGGRYQFSVGIQVTNAGAGELYTIDIYNNIGAVLMRRVSALSTGVAGQHSFGGTTTIPLQGGEQVFVNFTNTAAAGRTIGSGSLATWLQITRVSDL
jgi:hypothetical protein